jgi:hypothetical protein
VVGADIAVRIRRRKLGETGVEVILKAVALEVQKRGRCIQGLRGVCLRGLAPYSFSREGNGTLRKSRSGSGVLPFGQREHGEFVYIARRGLLAGLTALRVLEGAEE